MHWDEIMAFEVLDVLELGRPPCRILLRLRIPDQLLDLCGIRRRSREQGRPVRGGSHPRARHSILRLLFGVLSALNPSQRLEDGLDRRSRLDRQGSWCLRHHGSSKADTTEPARDIGSAAQSTVDRGRLEIRLVVQVALPGLRCEDRVGVLSTPGLGALGPGTKPRHFTTHDLRTLLS